MFVLRGWQEARRKNAIDKAKEQLVGLLEGLQGLQGVVDEDARPALQEAVKPTMAKVHESKIFEGVGNGLSLYKTRKKQMLTNIKVTKLCEYNRPFWLQSSFFRLTISTRLDFQL